MSTRLYVLPFEGTTISGRLYRGPRYFEGRWDSDPTDNVTVTSWSGISYGEYDWGIVAAEMDVTNHAALAAKPNVQQIPANIDSTVGQANRTNVQLFLEAMALPGTWVQNASTWREVVRTVCGFMLFASRFDAIRRQADPAAPALGDQLVGNLNVQWQNIPQATRDAFMVTAQTFNYDTSIITPTTLVRAILKAMADAWGTQPVFFGLDQYNGGVPFQV